MYTVYTWDNKVNRPLSLEESSVNKLMSQLLPKTKEEMWLVDFLYWIVPYDYIKEFSEANFAWAFIKNLQKMWIKKVSD